MRTTLFYAVMALFATSLAAGWIFSEPLLNLMGWRSAVLLLLAGIFTFYAYMEGVREAWYWHYRIDSFSDEVARNEHPWFLVQRTCVWLLVLATFWVLSSLWYALVGGALVAMIFLPIHQGMIYRERNSMDPLVYKKGFWDYNNHSTRFSTRAMTPNIRFIMLLVGIAGFVLWCVFVENK